MAGVSVSVCVVGVSVSQCASVFLEVAGVVKSVSGVQIEVSVGIMGRDLHAMLPHEGTYRVVSVSAFQFGQSVSLSVIVTLLIFFTQTLEHA